MSQRAQARSEPPVVEQPSTPPRRTRSAEAPQQIERRIVVPLIDEPEPGRIVYGPAMLLWALSGALIGALLLGAVAWLVASGAWAVAGAGQFAAAGTGVATFTGAGAGAALGALAGALVALHRIPAYRRPTS